MLLAWIAALPFSGTLPLSPTQKLVWHGITSLGPWSIGFGIGLVVALIGLVFTARNPRRAKVFWWTALITCWLVAPLTLWGSWRSKQLAIEANAQKEKAEQIVLNKIIELRDRYAEKARADQLQTLAEIKKLDVPSMISPSNLITNAGIARNRAKLAELTKLVERRGSLSQANMVTLQRDLAETVAGHVPGPQLRTWLAAAGKERTDLETQIYETQRSFISVLSELNEFMGAQVGRVVAQEGVMRFPTEQEAQRYNAYMQETIRLAQLESELLAKYQQLIEGGTSTLESLRR